MSSVDAVLDVLGRVPTSGQAGWLVNVLFVVAMLSTMVSLSRCQRNRRGRL